MTDARAASDSLTGEVLLGRYAVGERVAQGGFAAVYRARHLDLGVSVAVKVLTAADRYAGAAREAYLALFRQEALTLAALNHPAMVRVFDVGVVHRGGERPWIAMEWIEGVTLEDDLRARGGVGRSPREALELLRPAFDALDCAHEAGVSHRDIKPANLMLVRARRGDAPLRVIDFGVAKVCDAEVDAGSGDTATSSGLVAFSAPYAAPEQVGRTRSGPWTDVHALGLVVLELLAGRRAYREREGPALLEEILAAARPTASGLGLRVGPWETVLSRALNRAPASRPQRAGALWSELQSCVEEAQAAWALSPHAVAASRENPSSAETLDAPSAPRVDTPPSAPTRVSVTGIPMRGSPWGAVAAVSVGAALVAVALRPRGDVASQPQPAPAVVPAPVVAAPLVAAPLVAAPLVAAPAGNTPPEAPWVPRRPLRRPPARARTEPDAGTRNTPNAPAAPAEPRVVVE
jgi:serine/threonine-protein kinase